MKIGITQRDLVNQNGSKVDSLEQDYVNYYSSFGVELVPISNAIKDVAGYIEKLGIEKIILSGGGDVNPELYGGKKEGGVVYQPNRDRLETEILNYALSKKIPVLGECRGAQFLNVFFGGSMIQNLKADLPSSLNHVRTSHIIKLTDEDFVKLFTANSVEVNSFHQQGFTKKELSVRLTPFAESADGVVEGFYHPGLPIVGIMWHPERMLDQKEVNEKFIKNFIDN